MDSRGRRAAAMVTAVVAAVILFVVLRGGDDGSDGGAPAAGDRGASTTRTVGQSELPSKSDRPAVATITVRGGEPVGGVRELTFKSGDRVRFRVRSDVADEVHVHAYDLIKDVPAGGAVRFDFPATIEGAFEIELEGRKQQLAELRVEP